MRKTKQKEAILNLVNKLDTHPSPQDVYEILKEDGVRISLPTVYRLLEEYSNKGTILKIASFGTCERYDMFTHDHGHFYCEKCGSISDVDIEDIDYNLGNFEVNKTLVSFVGLCDSCITKH